MTSVWRKARHRITAVTWHELQTHAEQGVRKRFDLVKYRLGLPARPNSWNDRPTTAETFFFTPEDLPRITALLRKHLGGEVEKIILQADEICRHRFRLLGHDNLNYGPKIDWHFDAAHGKRAPLKPWFKIPFLKFSVVGDHKVTWELNRHQHLVTLAKAWALTHNEEYATELVRQWYAWRLANPFPMGINWASSLEIAFRSLSWLWIRYLLAGRASAPAFEQDLLLALAANGSYIEHYLSTYYSPNTHLLGEAVGLFFIGTLCPQIPDAVRWQNLGWGIVLQESERQVLGDGVYFEQSLYYHVYALDFLLHARILAALNQIEIPASFDATLGGMLDVLQAVSQCGAPHSFGDDDGGRVFNPARNRSEHLTDPLAIGAILFGRAELRSSASLTEESLWLFGERAVSSFAGITPRKALKATAFEAGGIYVMASSERFPQQMVIDAGFMGAGRGGHSHADSLGVTVSLDDRRWLVDPGTFCYAADNNERDRFRGTGRHNTLQVDGLDQAVPEGPFAWSSPPRVSAERWTLGTTFSMFVGSHTGYSRLPDPVLHRRCVFHLHGDFWLVRDLACGKGRHRLATTWNLAPDLRMSEADGAFVAFPLERKAGSETRLALVPVRDADWISEAGWDEVSPVYGMKQPSQILRIASNVLFPAECATIIAPLFRATDRPGKLSRLTGNKTEESPAACGYRYDEVGGVHYMIFSSGHERWRLGSWTSDAEFIYCSVRDSEVVQFIACGASFAKLNEKQVFTDALKISYVEWLNRAGTNRVFTSSDTAELSFSQDAFESRAFAI